MDEIMEDFFNDDGQFLSLETDEQIDLNYEFDAARYFDFSRAETPAEARIAELWLETECRYSPSPSIAKLLMRGGILGEQFGTCEESEDDEQTNGSGGHSEPDSSMFDDGYGEWKYSSRINQDTAKNKTRSVVKAPFTRVSTLMKPTASHLAKQTQRRDIKGSSRFKPRLPEPLELRSERSLGSSSVNESHAIKKQKLEGGYPRKVLGKSQQMTLKHKISTKNGLDCSDQPRLRLTIPREPELETSQRAHRIRPRHSKEVGGHVLSAFPSFKARPLNRKILTAPSMPFPQKSTPQLPEFQEFHLKTSRRAMQHSSAAPSVQKISNSDHVSLNYQTVHLMHISARNSKYSEQRSGYIPSQLHESVVDELKCERKEELHKFKARPLNNKILSSKGDMGIFRSNKRETTVTKEFNFQTEKRLQQNPPTELFRKLSLKSKSQQQNGAAEGAKENIDSLQQNHKMQLASSERLHNSGAKEMQIDDEMLDVRYREVKLWISSGIR